MASKKDEIKQRSMTRLLLPFSFFNHLDALQKNEKTEKFLKTQMGIKKGAGNLAKKKFSFYHAIVSRLHNNIQWQAIEKLSKNKLADAESVLLPRMFRSLFGSQHNTDSANIKIFTMDDQVRKNLLGEYLFVCQARYYKDKNNQEKQNFSQEKGFFALLSDLRLILSATGVGFMQIDLHLIQTENDTISFENKILDFNFACQYFLGDYRQGNAAIFMPYKFLDSLTWLHNNEKTGRSNLTEWTGGTVFEKLCDDMGIPLQSVENKEKERYAHLLINGDRFFTYNHLRLEQGVDIDESRKLLALRLSHRHNAKYQDLQTDEKMNFQPFETHYYALALEGVAVLQSQGKSKDFQFDPAVRDRHFWLILVASLYRFNLLNLAFQEIDPFDKKLDELRYIEKINQRIEYFTHYLYHSHVSNISHLQTLFNHLLEILQIHALWRDADRDIAQYLERHRVLLREQEEKKKAKLTAFAIIIACLVTLNDITALLERFEMLDKIPDSIWLAIALIFLLVTFPIFAWIKRKNIDDSMN